jgi:hypothetical protein
MGRPPSLPSPPLFPVSSAVACSAARSDLAVSCRHVPVRQLPFGREMSEAAGGRCPVHPPALAAAAFVVVTSARALPSPPRRGIFVVLWTREPARVRRGGLAAVAARHPELFLFGRAGCAGGVRFVPRGGGIAPITARAWDLSVTCMLSSCRTVPGAPCS